MEKLPIEKKSAEIKCTPEQVEKLKAEFLKKLQRNYGQNVKLSTELMSGERELDEQQVIDLKTGLQDLNLRTRRVHERMEERLAA